MEQFSTIREISGFLSAIRSKGLSVGFVPTMGALHEGHLALVRRSLAENDRTVCSIFVNPLQFNNREDLEKYPRNVAVDMKMLAETGCDAVFNPETPEMYPEHDAPAPVIDLGMLDKVMEGRFRPGHFKGVAVVVRKLFRIVRPDRAYFGKKDFQQLVIIRYLVEKEKLPVSIIACETVREPDGLAMSSRNLRLSIAERMLAPRIYQVLRKAREKAGKVPVRDLKEWAVKKITETPEFRVEYFEIGDRESLLPIENWKSRNRAVAFVAVFLGDIRLIDNLELFS